MLIVYQNGRLIASYSEDQIRIKKEMESIMEVSTLKKDTIERLRKVKKEQEFTIAHILDLLE